MLAAASLGCAPDLTSALSSAPACKQAWMSAPMSRLLDSEAQAEDWMLRLNAALPS